MLAASWNKVTSELWMQARKRIKEEDKNQVISFLLFEILKKKRSF